MVIKVNEQPLYQKAFSHSEGNPTKTTSIWYWVFWLTLDTIVIWMLIENRTQNLVKLHCHNFCSKKSFCPRFSVLVFSCHSSPALENSLFNETQVRETHTQLLFSFPNKVLPHYGCCSLLLGLLTGHFQLCCHVARPHPIVLLVCAVFRYCISDINLHRIISLITTIW